MDLKMINAELASKIFGLLVMVTVWAAPFAASAQEDGYVAGEPTVDGLARLSFLEGHWRGDNDGLDFEEVWNAPSGGVMTGMARGVRDNALAVLEYIVITDSPKGPVMRFKHFRADYTNWDGEEEPITLYLGRLVENDISFINDDPEAVVQGIRYAINADGQLQADITLLREGVTDRFQLIFDRVGG